MPRRLIYLCLYELFQSVIQNVIYKTDVSIIIKIPLGFFTLSLKKKRVVYKLCVSQYKILTILTSLRILEFVNFYLIPKLISFFNKYLNCKNAEDKTRLNSNYTKTKYIQF